MIKCFTFDNFKSFEKAELNLEALTTLIGTNSSGKSNAIEGIAILAKAATGIELNTILDGTKSTGAVVRGGSRGCARFKTNAFKLGCLIDLDETNDLLYEIKIGVGDRIGIEEEGLYIVKSDTFGPKTNKIFKTKKAETGRVEIKVQYNNGMRGNDPDTICTRSSAILPQMVIKMGRNTKEEKTIISYMDRVISHLKNISMLDPVPSVIRDYVRTSDVELRQNCDNLSAALNEMCKDALKKDEEYFSDDIVSRFCEWVKIVYGEKSLETNLDFIARALGNKGNTSREVIRNYFLNNFFKDHCNTYSVTGSGKRPIYWLFDSGKQNGFKALIYMHRYDADTVGRVRTDYLHRAQKYVENAMQSAQYTIDNAKSASEKSKATKAVTKYTKQLAEMKIYDEAIAHVANQRIEIDLDDGVKVNYAKFQGVEVAQEGKKTSKVDLLAKI